MAKKNHDQFGSLSVIGCDGVEEKPWQPIEYVYGNQPILETGFL